MSIPYGSTGPPKLKPPRRIREGYGPVEDRGTDKEADNWYEEQDSFGTIWKIGWASFVLANAVWVLWKFFL